MRALMWFRSDLRVADNTALHRACRDATRGVVGVFVISPGEWRAHDVAAARVDLMLRTVRELSASLERLNVPLLVRTAATPGEIPAVLARAAADHACDAVYFNREYELNESRRDVRVAARFEADGRRAHGFDDQVFAPPGEVRTGEGRFFTVFTPFRKALYARLERVGLPEVLGRPRKQAELVCEPDAVPERAAAFESTIDPALWPAGEKHAAARLAKFIERGLRGYKSARDLPAADGTSGLSAYLNIGAVSCRQCLHAAAGANGGRLGTGPEGITQWISELVWREFYIHILVGFPRVCMHRAFQPLTERIRWNENTAHLEAWQAGRTGVPIVDAGMRQLARTGWMHNRVRMITAMYFAKNLFLDWRLGERFFMQNLVDGFLASNNGGWQWSASTGTDAAPYFRVFNPASQSRTHDPEGAYIREFVPELRGLSAEDIHQPWELPPLARAGLDYPEPLVDLSASRARAIEAFRAIKA